MADAHAPNQPDAEFVIINGEQNEVTPYPESENGEELPEVPAETTLLPHLTFTEEEPVTPGVRKKMHTWVKDYISKRLLHLVFG